MEEILHDALETEDHIALIDEIMTKYGQEILYLVYSYVKNKTIAEDLTQDIFVKCYKSLDTYNGQSKLKTWLWRIAINYCKDYLKSWYNKKVSLIGEPLESVSFERDTVEETVIQKDEDEKLVAQVMSLPVKYREVIFLFYFEEMPLKEIAEITGVNENTVKTRLRRAKELLKEQLREGI